MGQGSEEDVAEAGAAKPTPNRNAIFTILQVLMTDLLLFGCMIPLYGTCVGGFLAFCLNLGPTWELLLIIYVVFTFTYGMVSIKGEDGYWRPLFAFEKLYGTLFQIRDLFNSAMLLLCVIGLALTIEAMIIQDKGIKSLHVSEGMLFILLKGFCQFIHVDGTFIDKIRSWIPYFGASSDASLGGNGKYKHGAFLMLFSAVMTGCVARLVYFKTMSACKRAIEIVLYMKPTFDENRSKLVICTDKQLQWNGWVRLENEFARGILPKSDVSVNETNHVKS